MFLESQCFFSELTDELLSTCQSFSCGNEDLDDFFKNDATRYAYYLMGKSYCFRKNDDPTKIVCAFTVSNDSIRMHANQTGNGQICLCLFKTFLRD